MSLQSVEIEHASLGEYLRSARVNLGLDLNSIAEETKISSKNLQAIESNDFALLPAEAFARGLYILYAKMLSLDCEAVLQRYLRERPPRPGSKNRSTLPPNKRAQEVGNMAKRPSFRPFSFFSLILLLSLIFGGLLCWLLAWNPALYLSQKLRSLEDNPQQAEQELESRRESDRPESVFAVAQLPQRLQDSRRNWFTLSSPATAAAAGMEKSLREDSADLTAQLCTSSIRAAYRETIMPASVTSVTNGRFNDSRLSGTEEAATRHMVETLVNSMQDGAGTGLTLNDIPVDLLQPDRRATTNFSLPEQRLQ